MYDSRVTVKTRNRPSMLLSLQPTTSITNDLLTDAIRYSGRTQHAHGGGRAHAPRCAHCRHAWCAGASWLWQSYAVMRARSACTAQEHSRYGFIYVAGSLKPFKPLPQVYSGLSSAVRPDCRAPARLTKLELHTGVGGATSAHRGRSGWEKPDRPNGWMKTTCNKLSHWDWSGRRRA